MGSRRLKAVGGRIWRRLLPLLLLGALLAPSAIFAKEPVVRRLRTGTPWETAVYDRASTAEGPTVLVIGGIHGDEPAGALAADQIRRWPIQRGRVVVIPRANELGLQRGTRRMPGVETSLGDLNRNFPRAGRDEAPRGAQARALWQLVTELEPDWLIDLHEGYHFHVQEPKSVGSTVIHSGSAAARRAARLMVRGVNATVHNTARRFVPISPAVNGSLARAASAHLGIHSMILETTTRSQARSRRVRQHRIMVHRLLRHLEMLPAGGDADAVRSALDRDDIWVALYDSSGTGGRGVPLLSRQLGAAEGIRVMRIGPDEIRSGALAAYDVVMFSGGLGGTQARTLDVSGREAVRDFIDSGGGYVGICAGAYLCLEGYSWGLKVVNAKTISPKWARGGATLDIELTEAGREVFGDIEGPLPILYHNGPVVMDAGADGLRKMVPFAYFREEVARGSSPKGIMKDSPAIFGGQFGAGRVIAFSPHPEQTKGHEALILDAVRWAALTDRSPVDSPPKPKTPSVAPALFRGPGSVMAKREMLDRLFRIDTREAWGHIREALGGIADRCAELHAERVGRWADVMTRLATPLPHGPDIEQPLLRTMNRFVGDTLLRHETLLADAAWRLAQRPPAAWRPLVTRSTAPGRNPWLRMTGARIAGLRVGRTTNTSARVAVASVVRRALDAGREPDVRVRLAALEAIAEQPEPPSEMLLPLLDAPGWDVRVRTATLLAEFGEVSAVPALEAAYLRAGARERVALDAALRTLAPERSAKQPGASTGANFYGLSIESGRVVFLIDVSGSMAEPFRPATDDVPAVSRLESAKTELKRLVRQLRPDTQFNVIAFSTAVIPWKSTLQPADEAGKAAVTRWIDGWTAAGNTCLWGGLREAFREAGLAPRGASTPSVDTLVVLSDGRPTYYGTGKPGWQSQTQLLRWLGQWNPRGLVRMHTVSLAPGAGRTLLKALATRFGGEHDAP